MSQKGSITVRPRSTPRETEPSSSDNRPRVSSASDVRDRDRKTEASTKPEAFEAAAEALRLTEGLVAGTVKAQVRFLLGATYIQRGPGKLRSAIDERHCQNGKDAKILFIEAKTLLTQGVSIASEATRMLMGTLMQLDPAADQMIKGYCR